MRSLSRRPGVQHIWQQLSRYLWIPNVLSFGTKSDRTSHRDYWCKSRPTDANRQHQWQPNSVCFIFLTAVDRNWSDVPLDLQCRRGVRSGERRSHQNDRRGVCGDRLALLRRVVRLLLPANMDQLQAQVCGGPQLRLHRSQHNRIHLLLDVQRLPLFLTTHSKPIRREISAKSDSGWRQRRCVCIARSVRHSYGHHSVLHLWGSLRLIPQQSTTDRFWHQQRANQRVSIFAKVFLVAVWLAAIVLAVLVATTNWLNWLTYLYFFSYVKLTITIIKYIPQVSVGWV